MIVVDASVAVQWIVPEAGTPQSMSVLSRDDLAAPALLQVEVANALRRKVAAGDLTLTQASEGFLLIDSRVKLHAPTPEWLDRALQIAVAMSHPIYDCLYLALAERQGCHLLTRDKEFIGRAGRLGMGHLFAPSPIESEL